MVYATFLGDTDFTTWVHDWVPLIFMGLLVVLVFMTMRLVPRTKPAEIRPETTPPIAWDDIAGAEEAKAELREIVDYMRDAKRFRTLGAHLPAGILLHGPPGTGKTLLAKAVAHESGASFFSQSASSFVEMFAGLGSARIRRLFKEARKHAPAIIFIDELDAVGTARSGGAANREYDQTLNQLLVEMDGFDGKKDVVVIAASNLLEKLDPALLRPGRFDRHIFVSPPDVTGRERILEVHSRDKPVADTVDFGILARQTAGPHRRRPGQHLQRGRHQRRPPRPATRSTASTSTRRSSASSPACSRAGASTTASGASSPSTRPATPSSPSCCRPSTRSTGSRSSPAAGRWATRSTCPPRTATCAPAPSWST